MEAGQGTRISERTARFALTIIVLTGAVLCLRGLDRGLWYDEIATLIHSVRAPLGFIVSHFPSNNDHLLYSVLANLSISVFGEHAWSLRLPAALFGIAACPMLYFFGQGLTSRFEALAAALLLAVSYHLVWFSQNARAYTIMLFLTLLGTSLLLRGLRDNSRPAWAGYALVTALSAYSHLTMVLVAAAQGLVVGLHLLARPEVRRDGRKWAGAAFGFGLAAVLTLLLYMPVMRDVQAFFGQQRSGVNVASASWALGEALRGLQVGYASGGAVAVVGLLCAVGARSYYRQSPLVLGLFIVPALAVLGVAVALNRPTFPRFFFFVAGFALLIVVRGALGCSSWILRIASSLPGVERLRGAVPWLVVAGMAAVSASSLPYLYQYPKQDFEGAMQLVTARMQPGDAIYTVGVGTEMVYQKFYGHPWLRLADEPELARARGDHDSVWLLYTFQRYLDAQVPALMDSISRHCVRVKEFSGTLAGGSVVVARCGRAGTGDAAHNEGKT